MEAIEIAVYILMCIIMAHIAWRLTSGEYSEGYTGRVSSEGYTGRAASEGYTGRAEREGYHCQGSSK